MGRRAVQRARRQRLDAHRPTGRRRRRIRTSGSRCAARTPGGPGTEGRRSAPTTRRGSRHGCDRDSSRAAPAVPADRPVPPGQLERHPDAGEVVQLRRHDDGVGVDLRAVVARLDVGGRCSTRSSAGRLVEPGVQPRLERRAAHADPAAELAQDLVAVVVDGRAEDAQLDRRREQSSRPGGPSVTRPALAGRRATQLDLVPRDELAGRRPRCGRASGEADRQVRVGVGGNLARHARPSPHVAARRRGSRTAPTPRPRRRRATPSGPPDRRGH